MYTKVRSILVSYFIHMNRSFDVKKRTLTKPFIEFIIFKINFLVFVQKNGLI